MYVPPDSGAHHLNLYSFVLKEDFIVSFECVGVG